MKTIVEQEMETLDDKKVAKLFPLAFRNTSGTGLIAQADSIFGNYRIEQSDKNGFVLKFKGNSPDPEKKYLEPSRVIEEDFEEKMLFLAAGEHFKKCLKAYLLLE